MLNWQEIVQKYTVRHFNKIRATTQPLRDHFGINYFTYHKIAESGQYTVLVDRPDWAEHYVDRKIFLNDPYLRHPSVYRPGICLVEDHGSKAYQAELLREGAAILRVDMGAILIQKTGSAVEFFGFGAKKDRSSLQNLYLNHPEQLESFARHFRTELAPILSSMEHEAGLLSELKGEDFFCPAPIHPEVSITSLRAFQKDLGSGSLIKKSALLSSRERQCLKLLLQNHTAKESAHILGLSHRTVEGYFENIKNKLSCATKREVLALAKNLDELAFL